jgi:hypothetical protein
MIANKLKVQCNAGHPLSGPNVYRTPQGFRQCRTCKRVAWQRCERKRRLRRFA